MDGRKLGAEAFSIKGSGFAADGFGDQSPGHHSLLGASAELASPAAG